MNMLNSRWLVSGLSCLVILPMLGVGKSGLPSDSYSMLHNDVYWTDQDGARILTRSGCLSKFGDTFYWYGGNPRGFREQHCYTSTDLVNWTHKGVVLSHDTDANRIDVLYNDRTKQYVMFLKYDGNGAHFAIATSDKPEGPFTFREKMLIDGALIGDMSVFQDDDGAAYLCYVSWAKGTNAQHGIYRMSDDYLKPEKRVYLWDIGSREAPHIFKRNGIYYYGTSHTAWIDSSGTAYYTARSLEGPWSPAKPMVTPGSNNSWDTQCDFVFPIRGKEGTVFLYAGDRWLKNPSAGRNGDYVWLPMEFDGDTPVLRYHEDWELDLAAGTWRAIDPARDLARGKPVTTSSELAPHLATYVTAPRTTGDRTAQRWESEAADPQWMMVDLEKPMEVNRVILRWADVAAKEFKIQTSLDGQSWTDVHTGQDGFSYGVSDVRFATTSARYVRVWGMERAAPPPPAGRRIVSGPGNSTQPVFAPGSRPETRPNRPSGYSIFECRILKD